jgi:HEAT repeat protein
MARAAVRSGAAVFASLLADRDPEVRRAAPTALVRFLGEPARVLDLLRERLADETDARVRLALSLPDVRRLIESVHHSTDSHAGGRRVG